MHHLDLLIQKHPKLRSIDYQQLIQRAKADPAAHWDEIVESCAPIAFSLALRLAGGRRNAEAIAEEATAQLFGLLAEDDFRRIREYVGFGRWPSLLLRWTAQVDALASDWDDEDPGIPEMSPETAALFEKEGPGFPKHMKQVLGGLHRGDRLLLGMRYDSRLTLHELDHLFRLGSPMRIQSLLERLAESLQPLRAVGEAWKLSTEQREAVLAKVVADLFEENSMESDEDRKVAEALQHR